MTAFSHSSLIQTKNDVLSGLTVALALVPEAVAFAFVAHVAPMVGLYAAVIVGFITALLGGRPGMISGATGAMAVVVVSLVDQHGAQYLFAAVLLAGIFQVLAGCFRLGKFIRLIPHPVMIGFVNGLAVIIFLAQMRQFKLYSASGHLTWLQGTPLYIMLALIALTMAIIYFLPKLTKAVPSSLAAILIIAGLVHFLGIDTRTVIDFVRTMSHGEATSLAGNFPPFVIPHVPMAWETFKIILPYAFILASVSLLETLLTLEVVDEMTQTRGNSTKESLAQGFANIICAFFGGMGGGAMIGQSMINVRSGGRGRLSGIIGALGLLFFVMVGSKWIQMIPLAALVGVMFMVVIGTFKWASLAWHSKMPKQDFFTIVLVTVVTVFTNLATAVLLGVIYSALVFAWNFAKKIRVSSQVSESGEKVYQLHGILFFGSVNRFLTLFNVQHDPNWVILDCVGSDLMDHSALKALQTLTDRYEDMGKTIKILNLSESSLRLIDQSSDLFSLHVVPNRFHLSSEK